MKKLLIAVVLIILILFASIYLFIPAQIKMQESAFAIVSPAAATRFFSARSNWHKWWPQVNQNGQTDSLFYFGNSSYVINQQLYNGFNIEILSNKDSIHSFLSLVPWSMDTLQIQWNGLMETSVNPFKRISQYRQVSKTRDELNSILSSLVRFLQKHDNVYGMEIRREIVKDTLLVFKESLMNAEPTTSSIETMVNDLRNHIRKEGARETNYPMMNVIKTNQSGANQYRVMVAIPIDREISLTDSIAIRKMVQGWILVSDIKGGPITIKNAFSEMRNFVNDYSKIPIAVPFESMVTDRVAEPDTAKWMTRIYFPIVL